MWMIDRLLLLLRQVLEFKQIQKLRPELLSLVVISLIMSGLWAFSELANEVMEGAGRLLDAALEEHGS